MTGIVHHEVSAQGSNNMPTSVVRDGAPGARSSRQHLNTPERRTPRQVASSILSFGMMHLLGMTANIIGLVTNKSFESYLAFLIYLAASLFHGIFGMLTIYWLAQLSRSMAAKVHAGLVGASVFLVVALVVGVNLRFPLVWFCFPFVWFFPPFWACFVLEVWLGLGTRAKDMLVDIILKTAGLSGTVIGTDGRGTYVGLADGSEDDVRLQQYDRDTISVASTTDSPW
ncbi:uncharacterized protein B0I36DRAFT_110233 [Microdochium trichocladiopsis]|uniref:Uncharacterized protein n=1 Tax=Microdochium trichocladiopsis TaxID=1682393 RepID=A0A9P8YCF3_9PEZI|nr:uncharacterized protein B0I36DRAFT_110233 [Microdochium trichocladiopsis]KAH7033533.1 hypothetical protein B0I36DRAFT_110233 [Microdochium trichocladiopsis]